MTDVEKQIEEAFGFRGHVTLSLKNGEKVEGFLFNRVYGYAANKKESFIEVFPKGSDQAKRFPMALVASVAMTGEDCAAGNSYEDYLRKKRERESKA